MEPIEVIRNSKKAFVREKYLIWDKGTDRQTDRQTHRHTDTRTDPYIELCYAQQKKMSWAWKLMEP